MVAKANNQEKKIMTKYYKILPLLLTICIIGCKVSKPIKTATPNKTEGQVFGMQYNQPIAPTIENLKAIQLKYKETTMQQLQDGHTLYTKGACIQCHEPENINKFSESNWEHIIKDMAFKANINDVQKDAVYKYVLSIKAAVPK
jgi:hypothetical protein